jgi:hypothetical protein
VLHPNGALLATLAWRFEIPALRFAIGRATQRVGLVHSGLLFMLVMIAGVPDFCAEQDVDGVTVP